MAAVKFKQCGNQNSFRKHKCGAGNVIQELKEKMSRLKFRLFDSQNQNHLLRKELLLAKKVVEMEISPKPKENFTDLLNQSSNDFRGRREKILFLKNKLSELQNRIKELEDSNVDNLSEDPVTTPKGNRLTDCKMYQNKQMMNKELQYLLENSCQMKRKLEVWKKRNVELGKEEEILRLELDRLMEKSKEDQIVHESYNVVEKELRARQAEKLEIRSKLDVEKTRNEQLAKEISTLRQEITLHLNKTSDDKVLIEALTNQQGCLYDLLERQKMISESDNRQFIDDIREIQSKHSMNCNTLSHLHDIVSEKSLACLELQESMKQKGLDYDLGYAEEEQETTATSITADSEQSQETEPPQQISPASSVPPEVSGEAPSETEAEEARLSEECEQFKNIIQSVQEEIDQMTSAMSFNNAKLNEWISQLFQTRSLLAQKNAEVRDLEETAKRLQKAVSSSKRKDKSSQVGSTFVEEMWKMIEVLNEEHQSLVSLWELVLSEKENSMDVYNTSFGYMRNNFIDAVNKLISLEDMTNLEQVPQAENGEKSETQQLKSQAIS